MKSTVILMEKILMKRIGSSNFTVRVHATKSGNLPRRAPYKRNVYRQTSLNEFMDKGIGSVAPLQGPLDIVYTVHARQLKPDKISEICDILVKDIDFFLYQQR